MELQIINRMDIFIILLLTILTNIIIGLIIIRTIKNMQKESFTVCDNNIKDYQKLEKKIFELSDTLNSVYKNDKKKDHNWEIKKETTNEDKFKRHVSNQRIMHTNTTFNKFYDNKNINICNKEYKIKGYNYMDYSNAFDTVDTFEPIKMINMNNEQ